MATKKNTPTFISLRNEIMNSQFRPVYVLNGEEPYYIDKLSDLIVEKALDEDERDFNLNVYYGNDASVAEVINTCKQYPAFAQRRVVVLREAQLVEKQAGGHKNDLDLLASYAQKPLSSTVLVICYKGGSLKSKPLQDALMSAGTGVVMKSDKIRRDSDLRDLVSNYAVSLGCAIDTKSTSMMCDHIGNDLARMFGELEKLSLLVDEKRTITPELIERNIGFSKDYNNFELQDALRNRNAKKAYTIVDYFRRNPKENSPIMTVSMLFGFFSKLLLANTSTDRSPAALAKVTGTAPSMMWTYEQALRNYNTRACVNILHYIRECDVKCKGMGSRQDSYDLLRELVYKILHA